MAKMLVIVSSPLGDDAVSTQVTNAFVESYKAVNANDEVITIDANEVKDIKLTKTLLTRTPSAYDLEVAQNREALLQQFLDADKIVVASPMWNFGLPGFLKEVLDTFMVAGKTFKYLEKPNEKGEVAVGLTENKKLLFIEAMGGFNDGENNLAYQQVSKMFYFMGVGNQQLVCSVANDIPGKSSKDQAIEEVKTIAKTF